MTYHSNFHKQLQIYIALWNEFKLEDCKYYSGFNYKPHEKNNHKKTKDIPMSKTIKGAYVILYLQEKVNANGITAQQWNWDFLRDSKYEMVYDYKVALELCEDVKSKEFFLVKMSGVMVKQCLNTIDKNDDIEV